MKTLRSSASRACAILVDYAWISFMVILAFAFAGLSMTGVSQFVCLTIAALLLTGMLWECAGVVCAALYNFYQFWARILF